MHRRIGPDSLHTSLGDVRCQSKAHLMAAVLCSMMLGCMELPILCAVRCVAGAACRSWRASGLRSLRLQSCTSFMQTAAPAASGLPALPTCVSIRLLRHAQVSMVVGVLCSNGQAELGDPESLSSFQVSELTVLFVGAQKRSFLLILDASNLQEIARAWTKDPVSLGFHGHFGKIGEFLQQT